MDLKGRSANRSCPKEGEALVFAEVGEVRKNAAESPCTLLLERVAHNRNQSIWHFGGVVLPSKKYCLPANLLGAVAWSS